MVPFRALSQCELISVRGKNREEIPLPPPQIEQLTLRMPDGNTLTVPLRACVLMHCVGEGRGQSSLGNGGFAVGRFCGGKQISFHRAAGGRQQFPQCFYDSK